MAFGLYETPGMDAVRETVERNLIWGKSWGSPPVVHSPMKVYSSALLDAGSSPTTDIRAGLLVAELTSSGELEEWDADATDGTQNLYGVVPVSFSTLDVDGTAADKLAPPPIIRAPLVASQLLIQGTALTSHNDEFIARRALHQMGCILDDDPQGYKAGVTERVESVSADTTVVEADNGTVFIAHTNDVEFTLPTIHAGLKFEFAMTSNQELQVTSAEGDNIVGGNDASGDSIVYTTTGEQIGARLVFESHYANGTLKWFYFIKKVAFSTDDFLAFTFNT